jgi:hypothetical protein
MNPLIFLHAVAGLLGIMAFGLAFLELRKPGAESFAKAHMAGVLGVILLLFSWAMGGFHYITVYGPQVKPLILASSDWAHDLGTETKEHVFLFLPFLAVADVFLIDYAFRKKSAAALKLASTFALAIFILGLIVAFEGFVITNAARAALEARG